MTMNPLPPQAYTKDTLTKAYLWLLNQNDSIKELATTPDVLVTLFLKAQRNGDDSLDTPSIQNFKNELKSLAGMMGELESKPNGSGAPAAKTSAGPQFRSTATMPPFVSSASSSSQATSSGASMPLHPAYTSPSQASGNPPPSSMRQEVPPYTAPQGTQHSAPQGPQYSTPSSTSHSTPQSTPHSAPWTEPASTGPGPSLPIEIIAQLDVKSRAMVAEVREQLNLGSDVEVLRLLISLGYKKARNLYS